jgi:hypothetical protein
MNTENTESIRITKERALKIANENASKFYNDLSVYKIDIKMDEDKWIINYLLKDPRMVGGGPNYAISAKTGEIVSFRFEQ